MRRIRLKALPRPPTIHHKNIVPQAPLLQKQFRQSQLLRAIIGSPLVNVDVRNPKPVSEDSQCIHLFRHFRTNRVLYSRSRNLNPQEAHEQLTFFGKKTVPGVTRVEIVRPPPEGQEKDKKLLKRLKKDPILIVEAGTRKDLWRPMATIKFPDQKLADFAFTKLRDLRTLRDYAWKQLGLPAPTTKRERRAWLMDQRGSSVADLATAIEHLNDYIFKSRDQVLQDWKAIQLLAESALNGKLEEINQSIASAEKVIGTDPSPAAKRQATKNLVSLTSQRYRMLRAIQVVSMVNKSQDPESLETALQAEQLRENNIKHSLDICNAKITRYTKEKNKAQAQAQNDPDSEIHVLAISSASRRLATNQSWHQQLIESLEASKTQQKSLLKSLEEMATPRDEPVNQDDIQASNILTTKPILNQPLKDLAQKVIQLRLHDQMESLDESDIDQDYQVTIYWDNLNDRKHSEEWPENIHHKPMGLRPSNLKFVASLPSQIEDLIQDADEFQGSEGINDSINLLPQLGEKAVTPKSA